MKRIAYGYRRHQKDFAGVEYDHIFLDTERSRPVLAETIKDFLYRGHDDVVLIMEEADIPALGPFRGEIERKGATIEVIGLEGAKPGPKQVLDGISAAKMRKVREIWNTPYFETHAQKEIEKVIGRKISRRTLQRHLGERDYSAHD